MKKDKYRIRNFIIAYGGVIIFVLMSCVFASCSYSKQKYDLAEQITKGKWKKLSGIENIGNDYFVNALEWQYDHDIEKQAACAVENYSKLAGIKNEEWELTHLYREQGFISVFTRSKNYRELFLLLEKDRWLLIADIQRGDNFEIDLMDGGWSYHSDLNWSSFEEWFLEMKEFRYKVNSDYEYYQYDSVCMFPAECAMQAYLTEISADESIEWEIMYERFFIASSGCLADVWYTDGKNELHLVMDVWNKRYTVIDFI